MRIKRLTLKEGFNESVDTFSNLNLIYSKKNSKGKSTYLRFLFYALGYQIPSMYGIDYSKISVNLLLNERNKDFHIVRTPQLIKVTIEGENNSITYSLPKEHNLFISFIFNSTNYKVINNLLGILYIDQEKGWTLLNRGNVIGRIKFSIEELISGLAEIDCDELINKKNSLKNSIEKYNSLLDINKMSEEIYEKNGEIYIQDAEKQLTSSKSLLELKIREVKKKINIIDDAIRKEESFWQFIDSMNLYIKHNNQSLPVSRTNIQYSSEASEYLKARKSILSGELNRFINEKIKVSEKLKSFYNEHNEISQLFGESKDIVIDRQLATFSIDQNTVSNLLSQTQKNYKDISKKINKTLKFNNEYINKIYNYVKIYAKALKIEDKISNKEDFIFTTDIKSLSGAILQKMVFAFKIAFLKTIEEKLGTKLIMVLDSPHGKELDSDNLKLIMDLIEKELYDNQVFIASIFDDFKFEKKIVLKKFAIENREN